MSVDNCNADNPDYFELKYNCEDIKLDENVKKVPYCECVPMGIVGRTAAGGFSEEALSEWNDLYMTFSPPTGTCSRVRTPNAEVIKRNTKPWKDIAGKYEVKKEDDVTNSYSDSCFFKSVAAFIDSKCQFEYQNDQISD